MISSTNKHWPLTVHFGNDSEYRLGAVRLNDLSTMLSKEPAKQGTFKYSVAVTFERLSTPIVLDPEVQVDGGGGG